MLRESWLSTTRLETRTEGVCCNCKSQTSRRLEREVHHWTPWGVVKAKVVHARETATIVFSCCDIDVDGNSHQIYWSIRQDSECEHLQQDPKGGDLCLATAKPWETVVEAGHSTDVQIVCQSMGIGAKDSSNHLVAGFL